MSTDSQQLTRPITAMPIKASFAVYGLIVLSAIVLAPAWSTLLSYWRDIHDYEHGYLIALVSIVWLWVRRSQLDATGIRPEPRVLWLLVPTAFAWLIVWRANNELLTQLLMLVVIVELVYCFAGRAAARAVAGPIAYLIFAIPIWEQVLPLLQRMTVVAAQTSMGWMDVPVTVTGTEVTIPEGTFAILDGCSGKKYFMVTLAVAAAAGAINELKWRSQVVLLALAGVLAILANWIRVFVVIYLGHVTNMRHHFVAVEHRSLGNAIFVVLLAMVYFIAWRLSKREERIAAGGATGTAQQPVDAALGKTRSAGLAIVVPALVLSAMAAMMLWSDHQVESVRPVIAQQALSLESWQGPLPADPAWQPQYAGASDSQRVSYLSAAGDRVEVYVNVYGVQRQGSELVYFENTLYAPGDWRPHPAANVAEAISFGLGLSSGSIADAADDQRWAMKQVYVIGGWETSSRAFAQMFYGVRALFTAVPSGTLAVAARCTPDCASAEARLNGFWNQIGPSLIGTIPKKFAG